MAENKSFWQFRSGIPKVRERHMTTGRHRCRLAAFKFADGYFQDVVESSFGFRRPYLEMPVKS